MLKRVSALACIAPFEADGIHIAEAWDFALTQAAGDAKVLKKSFPKLPDEVGLAVEYARKTLFRVAPHQLWIVGHQPEVHVDLYLTPLSSSRVRIAIEGPRSRELLAKCAAIDFHPKVLTPGRFVMTGIHHTPAMIHCIGPDAFHLYALRTFALSLWEVLADAAQGFNSSD